MKKLQTFLVLGFVVMVFLSIGFFMQKEKEKEKRLRVENILVSYIQERDKTEAEWRKTLKDRDRKIDYLLGELKKEKKIKSRIISKVKAKGKVINLAFQTLQPKKGVELERIVVSSLPDIEGRVIAVDPENRLVVVNLGRKDNVKPGDRLSVYRGNDFIADIELVKIQNQLSAGAVLSKDNQIQVTINDIVRAF